MLEGTYPKLMAFSFEGKDLEPGIRVVIGQGHMPGQARLPVEDIQAAAVRAHVKIAIAGFGKGRYLGATESQRIEGIVAYQVEEGEIPVVLIYTALHGAYPIHSPLIDKDTPDRCPLQAILIPVVAPDPVDPEGPKVKNIQSVFGADPELTRAIRHDGIDTVAAE
jgi:hypothetical protein